MKTLVSNKFKKIDHFVSVFNYIFDTDEEFIFLLVMCLIKKKTYHQIKQKKIVFIYSKYLKKHEFKKSFFS